MIKKIQGIILCTLSKVTHGACFAAAENYDLLEH